LKNKIYLTGQGAEMKMRHVLCVLFLCNFVLPNLFCVNPLLKVNTRPEGVEYPIYSSNDELSPRGLATQDGLLDFNSRTDSVIELDALLRAAEGCNQQGCSINPSGCPTSPTGTARKDDCPTSPPNPNDCPTSPIVEEPDRTVTVPSTGLTSAHIISEKNARLKHARWIACCAGLRRQG